MPFCSSVASCLLNRVVSEKKALQRSKREESLRLSGKVHVGVPYGSRVCKELNWEGSKRDQEIHYVQTEDHADTP